MKRVLSVCICAVMAIMMLAGCGSGENVGKIGTTMKTYFFNFKVISAEAVDSFAGQSPEGAGNRFVVVEVETTNTFSQSIEMYDWDYQLQWDERDNPDTYAIVLDALDDTCAPLAYDLGVDRTMKYYYVYEVPADVSNFELCYLEEFEGDDVDDGTIHYVQFSV